MKRLSEDQKHRMSQGATILLWTAALALIKRWATHAFAFVVAAPMAIGVIVTGVLMLERAIG